MVNPVLINAIGSVVISALTLVGAVYLLWTLWKQGKGKLRVRLLIGTVASDILVGLVALPPEAMYIAGAGLETGTRGCNAMGFIFTTILFTQHLWTLCIAVATFMLLKHPLHSATTAMERYSWLAWPIIWGVAILHSGIWYATVGFSSSGNICYYASTSTTHVDGRDLVQFVPRALVFVGIVVLYSRLFSFLRRPDTIQLSTQFMTGSASEHAAGGSGGAIQQRVLRPFARLRLGSLQLGGARRASAPSGRPRPDPAAPWEQLEFVNVGAHVWSTNSLSAAPGGSGGEGGPANPVGSLGGRRYTHPASPATAAAFEHSMGAATRSYASQQRTQAQTFTQTASQTASRLELGPLETTPELDAEGGPDADGIHWAGPGAGPGHVHRPSEPDTLVTPVLASAARAPNGLGWGHDGGEGGDGGGGMGGGIGGGRGVSGGGALAALKISAGESDDDDDEYDDDDDANGKRRPSGQTLKEFFQDADQSSSGNVPLAGACARVGGGAGGAGAGGKALPKAKQQPLQISATAYFNRQASLLMLYFPLAYMFVFSVSLIRLIYDMVHHTTSPALTILSAWMVLSVGLIDALVFGLAEFIVRRRVRRKMPDRMG
ncbi:hypothetical protein Q5752_005593 [Cryptotrichosporon argae]